MRCGSPPRLSNACFARLECAHAQRLGRDSHLRAALPRGALAERETPASPLREGAAAEPRRRLGGRGRPSRRLAAGADHRGVRRARAPRGRAAAGRGRAVAARAGVGGRAHRTRADRSGGLGSHRMHAVELIERKRNGEEVPAGELREFVAAYARDEVPDYQAAALLMAVWFRGLSAAETYALTEAMVASGETVDLAAQLGRRVVDKHSTGGVGDKTTIAVGPVGPRA